MAKRDYTQFDLFRQMEREMQRFTDEALRTVLFHPRADVHETGQALIVKVELAGIKPDRLDVTLSADDHMLTIAGTRAESQEECRERIKCYQLEIYYGAFERTVELPPDVSFDRDAISATYRDGFLVITLPKNGFSEPQKRTIPVNNDTD